MKQFKIIAFLEGVSLLLLLFVAMPLKYIWDMPQMVRVVGMAHGVLFITYVFYALMLRDKYSWSIKDTAIILIASIIPFGTFYIEKRYLKAA